MYVYELFSIGAYIYLRTL